MEYQETADFLDNEVAPSASNQSSKFRTRDWVEINDESRGNILVMKLNLKLQC